MDVATPLGERIAYYRRRRGLSQVKLAGLLGRSESWLSQVERGVRSIDRISVLIEVAGALNVPVTELSPDPLIQEGPEPKTILTKLHKLPVAIADGQSNVPFVDVEEDITFTVTSRTALENYVLYVGFDAAALREAPQSKKTRRTR